ncbi:hypothetical protein ACOMHN_046597 [Nucella lapillus]
MLRREILSLKEKIDIIKKAEDNPALSTTSIGDSFGIARTTVASVLNNKVKYKQLFFQSETDVSRKRVRSAKFESEEGDGVSGQSEEGDGGSGQSEEGDGGSGQSEEGDGVSGQSEEGDGVSVRSEGDGVSVQSEESDGGSGQSEEGDGGSGQSEEGDGVSVRSEEGDGGNVRSEEGDGGSVQSEEGDGGSGQSEGENEEKSEEGLGKSCWREETIEGEEERLEGKAQKRREKGWKPDNEKARRENCWRKRRVRVVVCESVRLKMGKTTIISVSLPFIRPRNRHLRLQTRSGGQCSAKG